MVDLKKEGKMLDFIKDAAEEFENPYSAISRILWWDLFYDLNKGKDIKSAFKKESELIELIKMEFAVDFKEIPESILQKRYYSLKINFLKLLLNFYTNNQKPEIEDLNLKVSKKSSIDKMLLDEFTVMVKDLKENPEYWKRNLAEYSKYHQEIIRESKEELEKGLDEK